MNEPAKSSRVSGLRTPKIFNLGSYSGFSRYLHFPSFLAIIPMRRSNSPQPYLTAVEEGGNGDENDHEINEGVEQEEFPEVCRSCRQHIILRVEWRRNGDGKYRKPSGIAQDR